MKMAWATISALRASYQKRSAMKKVILICLLAAIAFSISGCYKPQPDYMAKGVITGPDYRKCMCCGGWFITIDSKDYFFWSVPAHSKLDLENETFPLKVKLDWKPAANTCGGNRIEVLRIKKE
jgi:hypothetical protein